MPGDTKENHLSRISDNMKLEIIAWLFIIIVMSGAAPLYTTQGVEAGGFTKDTDSCSVSILDSTSNILETHTIKNDCINKDIAYIDEDCFIYPVAGTVTYTIFLGRKYEPENYDVHVRCGSESNITTGFTTTAPNLQIIEFNQLPNMFTTLKFTAKTETEEASECTVRIYKTNDSSLTRTHTFRDGIVSDERGIFTFEHFLIFEAPYTNFTFNMTCNDYSTYQSTFKPVLLNVNDVGVIGFAFGVQIMMIVIAMIVGGLMLMAVYVVLKRLIP